MDLNHEISQIEHLDTLKVADKRKITNSTNEGIIGIKKPKMHAVQEIPPQNMVTAETFVNVQYGARTEIPSATRQIAHKSPKKRLQLDVAEIDGGQQKPDKVKFIYGNYNQYYGYRNKGHECEDIRLEMFTTHTKLFQDKEVLDIGCNSGLITMEVAKRFEVKSITGLDIDRALIKQANKALLRQKKAQPLENEARRLHKFPYNVNFVHANYVLRDDVLLEIEQEQFDVILCLSVTKWIHLNFGDAGLKQTFRRMYLQLRSGGKLVLEAQLYDNYKRRKKMTETIAAHYKAMQFLPKHFTDYLLSKEVGFANVELMGVPKHCAEGFKRAIQIFHKR
ncbi:probable RNA methyltransferase CG1239 [Eurosta solidaginis]|uniref:probable RNA methyltransferase CG1239 n=1 Tax=Eurosta solidaginis TaxID=178769 RepID=UPI003530DD9F